MMNDRMIISIMHGKAAISAGIDTMLRSSRYPRIAAINDFPDRYGNASVVITDYPVGLEMAVKRRSRNGNQPKIILVTDRIREWELRTALDSGVEGILTENCDSRELVEALERVRTGRQYLSGSIVERAMASLYLERLTQREEQVLTLVGKGLCNKLVARDLGIAEVTAKLHLQNIMTKLGVQTRTQAVVIGSTLGLIDLHE